MWQIWLIISGLFFIFEIITTGFLVFWLGIGALFAMLVSIFTDSILIQTTVFVISSALLIFLTKPFIEKYVSKKKEGIITNAFSLIGKTALVIETINDLEGTGQIKVEGEVWSAKSQEGIIEKGSQVQILSIEGVKVFVQKIADVSLKQVQSSQFVSKN